MHRYTIARCTGCFARRTLKCSPGFTRWTNCADGTAVDSVASGYGFDVYQQYAAVDVTVRSNTSQQASTYLVAASASATSRDAERAFAGVLTWNDQSAGQPHRERVGTAASELAAPGRRHGAAAGEHAAAGLAHPDPAAGQHRVRGRGAARAPISPDAERHSLSAGCQRVPQPARTVTNAGLHEGFV